MLKLETIIAHPYLGVQLLAIQGSISLINLHHPKQTIYGGQHRSSFRFIPDSSTRSAGTQASLGEYSAG